MLECLVEAGRPSRDQLIVIAVFLGVIGLWLTESWHGLDTGIVALAGAIAAKKRVPASSGTFPTHGPLFVGLLIGVILILGGLQFFPALALGPIVEHLQMLAGRTF